MLDTLTTVDIIVNRILLVEQDRVEADFLKEFLQSHRFCVEVTRDAGQARSAFNMHHPDFVILEAILPHQVSGFEVCEHMKRENHSTPVMMLTEIDTDDARRLAFRVGVDAYVTKPYDPAELLTNIRSVAEAVWRQHHVAGSEGNSLAESIQFACGSCQKSLKAKSVNRGRAVKCPRCGVAVHIPMN